MNKATLASLIGIALAGSASAQQDEADALQPPSKTSQMQAQQEDTRTQVQEQKDTAQQQAAQDVQRPNSLQDEAENAESMTQSDYQRGNEHAPATAGQPAASAESRAQTSYQRANEHAAASNSDSPAGQASGESGSTQPQAERSSSEAAEERAERMASEVDNVSDRTEEKLDSLEASAESATNEAANQVDEAMSQAEGDYADAGERMSAQTNPEADARKGTEQMQSQADDYRSRAQEQYQRNEQPAPETAVPAMADSVESGVKAAGPLATMNPDELEGQRIFNVNGEEVGDIDSIKVEKSTKERVAIVGIRGVIGDEMKEVAIPLSQLNVKSDGEGLETSMTKSQLEQRPDVDPLDEAYVDVDEFEEAE